MGDRLYIFKLKTLSFNYHSLRQNPPDMLGFCTCVF